MGFPRLPSPQIIGGVIVLGKALLTVMLPLADMVWHLRQDNSCVSRHIQHTFMQEKHYLPYMERLS
jgi:hypothetical protein